MQKKCSLSHCTELATSGSRCHRHKHKVLRKPKVIFESHKFYKTTQWINISKHCRQSHPVCELCKTKLSTQADHWIEIRMPEGENYKSHQNNIIALCDSCHAEKSHIIRGNGLTNYEENIKYLIENYPRLEGIDYLLEYKEKRKED